MTASRMKKAKHQLPTIMSNLPYDLVDILTMYDLVGIAKMSRALRHIIEFTYKKTPQEHFGTKTEINWKANLSH